MATKANTSRSYATGTTVPYKRQTIAKAPIRKLADASKVVSTSNAKTGSLPTAGKSAKPANKARTR